MAGTPRVANADMLRFGQCEISPALPATNRPRELTPLLGRDNDLGALAAQLQCL